MQMIGKTKIFLPTTIQSSWKRVKIGWQSSREGEPVATNFVDFSHSSPQFGIEEKVSLKRMKKMFIFDGKKIMKSSTLIFGKKVLC